MTNDILNLREQRAALVASMNKIIQTAKADGKELNTEQAAEWDKLDAAQEELRGKIETAERASKSEALRTDLEISKPKVTPFTATRKTYNPLNVLRAWALYRSHRATPAEWLEDVAACGINIASPSLSLRDLSKGTNSAGGYFTAPEDPVAFERYLKWYGSMFQVANIVRTQTGNSLPWPTTDDSSNVASIKGEAASIATNVDPSFGTVTFGSFKYSSGNVLVSVELLQDAAFPLESVLFDMIGERIARKANTDFTVGAGTTEPYGIVTRAGDSTVDINGAGISWTDLLDLIHSVDKAYRIPGRAKLMFNDATAKHLKKLVDGQQRPLFFSLSEGAPATFDGWDYVINNDMADLGTGTGSNTKPIVFGLLDKYVIRQIGDVTLYRLDELYAGTMEVGFGAHLRADGNLVNTSAVKYLKS